jgi:hypothetical protein
MGEEARHVGDVWWHGLMAAVNQSKVKNPSWTGADGEYAVVVSRGEPNRTDLQMEQAAARQIEQYLPHYTKVKPDQLVVALAVQLIAKDYIIPPGSRTLALTREHLLKYIEVAADRVRQLQGDTDAKQ